MYCINVKEQFDVRIMIKVSIFSRQGFNMFQAYSVLESTYYLFRTLAMTSFSVIDFYSAIEIGLYSLYRKKMIATFELNKTIVGSRYSFLRKKKMICLSKPCVQQKPPFCMCCVYACARERALMTRKSCAVRKRNAILRNNLKCYF